VVYPNEVDSPFSGVTSNMTRAAVGELVVFDAESGDVQHRVPDVGGKVARLSPDGRSVAVQAAGTDGLGSVVILDLGSGELIELPGLCPWVVGEPGECEDGIAGDVTDLAWSSDGSRLAAALGTSQRLLVWDVDSEDIVFESDRLGEQAWVALSAVAFNADGSTLAASSKHGMWIFDAATWDLRKRIHHPGRPSWVMAFTPDGSELITAQAHSGDVVVYDTRTWTERRFQGGVGQTRDMDLASDASMVALSSNDGTIHVLNVETGDLVDMISLDGRDITNIEFANGDRHLLITSSTGPVEVLTLEPDELIDVARTRVFRSFTAEECATYEIDPCPTLGELRDR
jgi:WD40 repeat protein